MQISKHHVNMSTPLGWEKVTFIAILILTCIIQINAILHHGVMGQDFINNYGISKEVSNDFAHAFHLGAVSNPPGYYLIDGIIIRLTHAVHDVAMIGFFNMLLNTAALIILYRIACHLISHSLLRISLLILTAFLPVLLIHSVVLAGDALTLLPFLAAAYLLIKLQTVSHAKSRLHLAMLLGLYLLCGAFCKFTFVSTIGATALLFMQFFRRAVPRIKISEAVLLLAITFVPPGAFIVKQSRTPSGIGAAIGINKIVNNMSYKSVFVVNRNDIHILDAPTYDEPGHPITDIVTGKIVAPTPTYELLIDNKYSYPALLHLGIFTDLLNIFQYDPSDNYFGKRSKINQTLMSIGVKTALPISIVCVIAVLFVSLNTIIKAIIQPRSSRSAIEVIVVYGFAWFANIALLLPFIPTAYAAGFWTPRLILPTIVSFLLLLFFALDRLSTRFKSKTFPILVFSYICLQSLINISFLWPVGAM